MTQELIKNIVEEYFELNIGKRTRKKEYIEARAIYYKLVREYTMMSLDATGKTVNTDHACVINGIRRLDGWLTYDRRMIAIYSDINDKVRSHIDELKKTLDAELKDNINNKKEDYYRLKYNNIKNKYEMLSYKYNFLIRMSGAYIKSRVASGDFVEENIDENV